MTLSRSTRFLVVLSALGAMALAALVGAQTGAAATRTCKTPTEPAGLNGGYFTELRATNVTCRSARKLVLAYYKCRRANGGIKGSCSGHTVNGLLCKETRKPELQSETQLNARVTCTKGTKKVRHSYQQNLVPG